MKHEVHDIAVTNYIYPSIPHIFTLFWNNKEARAGNFYLRVVME
jgi:hypothetical protein